MTIFASNFTAANNTDLLSISQSPYNNFIGDFADNCRITNNRVRRTTGATSSGWVRTNESFPSGGYLAVARILRPNAGSGTTDVFRFTVSGTDRNNCYRVSWFNDTLTLGRVVGGSNTTIGGSALSLTWGNGVTRDIGLRFNTATGLIELLVDGAVERSGTDTTYTNAGHVRINTDGAAGDDATTTGFHYESLTVTALGGAATTPFRAYYAHV